ncbi:hypothetical protein ElyMa_007070200 [Elysia marginata]|uniref:Uncharacterized protein n=1 Tax=Elysia marginata TaxID=1093978 RepID=A0AAV4K153_9GAST|nr:hypothetical protein ElyMa_007070200 [Elysia marginata]
MCYRRLLKVPCTVKKTDKEIIQMADVCERLLQHLMKRKLGYARHFVRGSSGPWLQQLSPEGKIEGKAKEELDGRCKGMIRVDQLWRLKRKAESRKEWRDMVANLRTEDGT